MVEASLVNIVEAIGILIGVTIAVYELRNIGKNRRLDTLFRHMEMNYSAKMALKWNDVAFRQEYESYEEWLEKYGALQNPEAYRNFVEVLNGSNLWGIILKERLLEPEILYQFQQPMSNLAVWLKAEPVIKEWRKRYNDPTLFTSFEYLIEDIQRRYPDLSIR
jgi:hypothetical protein